MGKTTRKSPIDTSYATLEGYMARPKAYRGYSRYEEMDKKAWHERHQDGKSVWFSRRTGGGKGFFKHLNKKNIRINTRDQINVLKKSGDWDDAIWTDDHDGKKFIWAVW